jgi:tRNA uracil 4-sulfurtransferase
MKYILCRYSEIGLKRNNRSFFENCLVDNIKRVINPEFVSFVKRISGRILIQLTEKGTENKEQIEKSLGFVFGIASFSFCDKVGQDLEEIKEKALELLSKKKFKRFKIKSQRANKSFMSSSQEINEKVGQYVLERMKDIKVDLTNPQETCFIEIIEDCAFVFVEKINSHGGLPTNSSGKAVSLLSGGIDSPVASFQAMRRGLKLIFVHCHSYPDTSQASIDKVKEIVGILAQYQGPSKLYLVPISEIQREIALNVSEKLRILFYRKVMLALADQIAAKEGALALITGDSVGQVSSQTIENLYVVEQGIKGVILRPLACQNKESIVKEAEKIGTFNISIQPYDDCCVRFVPQRPETRAKQEEMMEQEKRINIKKMVSKGIKELEILTI